jgi:large subunit ribosomal protein L25
VAESSIAVELRDDAARGKGVARRLRAAGRVPGVVYGPDLKSVAISVDPVPLLRLIETSHAGVNTLIDLSGASEVAGRTVLVKELQREPVHGGLLHVDFYEVDLTERIRVSVPIRLTGTAVGVTMGGLLDHSLRALELDCLPNAIPDEISFDVSALEQGDSIHVGDLTLPEGVELHSQTDLPVVSIVAPKAEEEVAEVEEVAVEEGAEGEAPAEGDAKAEDREREGEKSDS